jgi:hypothetical protein
MLGMCGGEDACCMLSGCLQACLPSVRAPVSGARRGRFSEWLATGGSSRRARGEVCAGGARCIFPSPPPFDRVAHDFYTSLRHSRC